MHTITISHAHGKQALQVQDLAVEVSDEFAAVIEWLVRERVEYQSGKWDYADSDLAHAEEGLDEESHFWNNGVLNYVGRVRLFGVSGPLGMQALLKLIATLASIPEHLLRGGKIANLPRAGVPLGDV